MRMAAVVVLVTSCCAFFAPPAPAQNYLPGVADIIAGGELKVGMFTWDAPPMIVTREDGTTSGFDVRIAEAIAHTLGVKLKIVRTEKTPNAVIEQVARGDVDIAVSYISRTPSRAKKVLFTRPYLTQDHTLLLNRAVAANRGGGCPTVETFLAQIVQTPLGILNESADIERVLHAQPNAKLVRFNGLEEMIQAVRAGTVGQSFQGEITVRRFLAGHPAMRVFTQVCELPHWTDQISIAVNGKRPELLAFLNVFLDHVVVSGEQDSAKLTIDQWYNE